ncbi:hypothetical protein JG687_00017105 [Phytophthora cactorum]|uniref:Ulp1 protease family, C-terminal catalytic domain n=1 Tax=Phytophthora cactorum TaxID=29920 RepID=A0A8T1TP45_9STRA|nr:hypothetical protein JG687_00017105 [Phytophthora cactorum]
MGHGIALLQREHPYIGLVNPISSRFQARDAQLRAINAGDPFKDTNKVIMLPLYVANNHWCGTVLDFGVKVEGSCCLTRSNSPSRNTTMNAKHSCRTYLVKYVRSYRSRDTQPYVTSCGPAVLMFFECLLIDITPFTVSSAAAFSKTSVHAGVSTPGTTSLSSAGNATYPFVSPPLCQL